MQNKELPDGYYYFNYSVDYFGEEISCDMLAIKTPCSLEASGALDGQAFFSCDSRHLISWTRRFMHIYLPLDFDHNINFFD